MFQKRYVLIGIIGILVTVLLTAVLPYRYPGLAEGHDQFLVSLCFVLVPFFLGLLVAGVKAGLYLGGAFAALVAFTALPDSWKGPAALMLFAAMILTPKVRELLADKKAETSDGLAESAIQQELERKATHNAVYLIKPNWRKADITYKVVHSADCLLFFRVGGQFYSIDPDIALNNQLGPQDTQEIPGSFAIPKQDAVRVRIKAKKRPWTGNIPNHGTVYLTFRDGGKAQYILHEINEHPAVAAFFETALGLPVEVELHQKQIQERLAVEDFARQPDQQKRRITRVTKALDTVGCLTGLWLLFYPQPVRLAVAVNIFLPVAGLAYYLRYSSFITLNDNPNRRQRLPSMMGALLIPALALMMVGLLGFNIVYTRRLWIALILITLVVTVLLYVKSREIQHHKWLAVFYGVLIFAYAYGAAITSNCLYGSNSPRFETARVVEKQRTSGSRQPYVLLLESWQEENASLRASVSENVFTGAKHNEDAFVMVFDGLWGIEWYVVFR